MEFSPRQNQINLPIRPKHMSCATVSSEKQFYLFTCKSTKQNIFYIIDLNLPIVYCTCISLQPQ